MVPVLPTYLNKFLGSAGSVAKMMTANVSTYQKRQNIRECRASRIGQGGGVDNFPRKEGTLSLYQQVDHFDVQQDDNYSCRNLSLNQSREESGSSPNLRMSKIH